MARRTTQKLIDYFHQRAGGALRVVFHYDNRSEDFEIMYMRDDIQSEYSERELETHFDTFRRDAHLAEVQQGKLRTGDHHCSIRVYDETLLFNFTLGQRYNTIISLDPDVGRDLLSFVAESMEQLQDEADALEWDPPGWTGPEH